MVKMKIRERVRERVRGREREREREKGQWRKESQRPLVLQKGHGRTANHGHSRGEVVTRKKKD